MERLSLFLFLCTTGVSPSAASPSAASPSAASPSAASPHLRSDNSFCHNKAPTDRRRITSNGFKLGPRGLNWDIFSRNEEHAEIQGPVADTSCRLGEAHSFGSRDSTSTSATTRPPLASRDENKPDEVVPCSVRARSKLPGISKLKPLQINIRKVRRDKIHGVTSGKSAHHPEAKPSHNLLKSLTQPLIPRSCWNSLTGREFFAPSCLAMLTKTGIRTATSSDDIIEWKPDKGTHKLFDAESSGDEDGAVRRALTNGNILVWTGRFKSDGYGSELPLVKTTWTLDMPPRSFAELLMDSSRVKIYNKMSLGRSDIVVMQDGIDSVSEKNGHGEAKIVRNLTKPPLTKRNMDFVTLMHARRMVESDNAGVGILGGGAEETGAASYVVVSRAVGGTGWADGLPSSCSSDNDSGGDECIRSEILLGINVIRAVPGQPGKSEVTAVTHCNSPSVPRALAGKVGVKGAVDFVKDVRLLCEE